ncbi:hypothetical protein QBC45DRAFT_425532 [Copromyces sp. CBS 386.78]|nr:hypothetical protein QBC45DRAFT_425532 [Copromyces sp. CBS 386.78]
MSLDSLALSGLDAGPQSRAQAPHCTCTPYRAPSSTACLGLSSTKKITTIHHLRSLVPHSYCVGIDVEGIEGIAQGVTSVGLSVLPPVFSSSLSEDDGSWPWPFPDHHQGQIDLDTMASHYRLQSYCFAILGRERARSYEHFHYGEVVHHPITHLQSAVLSVLRSVVRLHNPTAAPIILIGFDMELEHRVIDSVFPLLGDHVTHWCDISHTGLADARWHEDKKEAHKTHHLKISLRDTMLALNFRRNHGIQPRARHHSAGMDAVRTLGTMLALLARAPEAGGLVVKRYTWEEHGNRKLWEWVPRPADKFPWTVKIVPVLTTDDRTGKAHLPESLSRPARLFNFVTRNFGEPKAVAVCPPARSGPLKTHGWVSLHSEEEMERFVRDWDGNNMVVDGVMFKVGERPPPEKPPKTSLKHLKVAESSLDKMEDAQQDEEEEEEHDSSLAEELASLELDDTAEVGSVLDTLFQSDGHDSYSRDPCRTVVPRTGNKSNLSNINPLKSTSRRGQIQG